MIEAKHQVNKELPKASTPAAAFVDVSHIKTKQHLQFGREVSEVLIYG